MVQGLVGRGRRDPRCPGRGPVGRRDRGPRCRGHVCGPRRRPGRKLRGVPAFPVAGDARTVLPGGAAQSVGDHLAHEGGRRWIACWRRWWTPMRPPEPAVCIVLAMARACPASWTPQRGLGRPSWAAGQASSLRDFATPGVRISHQSKEDTMTDTVASTRPSAPGSRAAPTCSSPARCRTIATTPSTPSNCPIARGRPEGHPGTALAFDRSARRQPGADRSHDADPQAQAVQPAGRHGVQRDRDRLPVDVPDGLRVRPEADRRAASRTTSRCRADPGARGPDLAHSRVAGRGQAGQRPHVQRSGRDVPARGVRHGRGPVHRDGAPGTELVMKYAEQYWARRRSASVQPEIFTQTPTDFAIEVCNAVMDIWPTRSGPRDHPQPAGHR